MILGLISMFNVEFRCCNMMRNSIEIPTILTLIPWRKRMNQRETRRNIWRWGAGEKNATKIKENGWVWTEKRLCKVWGKSELVGEAWAVLIDLKERKKRRCSGTSGLPMTHTTCGEGRRPEQMGKRRVISKGSQAWQHANDWTCVRMTASLLLNDKSPSLSTGTTSRLLTHFIRFVFQLNTNSHLINQI